MRLANDRDQALLRSAVTDAIANLLAFVPSLGTREVVAFGEGVPLPARLRFSALPKDRLPQSETFHRGAAQAEPGHEKSFVRLVVERWRSAAGAPRPGARRRLCARDSGAPGADACLLTLFGRFAESFALAEPRAAAKAGGRIFV